MPGRCTLTATRWPLRRRARWTWPSEAAASGVASKSKTPSTNARPVRPPRSFHFAESERLDLVLQAGERFEIGARHQIDAGREQLAELDEGRPQLFEILREFVGFGRFLGRDVLLGFERFFEAGCLTRSDRPYLAKSHAIWR